MRGVNPALMSRRCRTWSRPSMLTSIVPAIAGWWLSCGPSKALNSSGLRLTAWTSSCFDSTQKPSSWSPGNPFGEGLPLHRFVTAKAGEDLVREPVAVERGVGEVDLERTAVDDLSHCTSPSNCATATGGRQSRSTRSERFGRRQYTKLTVYGQCRVGPLEHEAQLIHADARMGREASRQ